MADPAAAPIPEEPREFTDIDLGRISTRTIWSDSANVPEARARRFGGRA
jgi:hypothetical protein